MSEQNPETRIGIIDLVQDRVWAIHPAKMQEIDAFIMARVTGAEIPKLAAPPKSGNRADQPYQVQNGVALIPVQGVLSKRLNMLQEISGGTSTEVLKRDILGAFADPNVSAILLDVDSPGGSVDGTKALADAIFEGRGKKPVIAFANGQMSSAAYWIGSAASMVIAEPTAEVGSIGVRATHYDFSEADKLRGVKRTVVASGKYKAILDDSAPLSEDGQNYLQDTIDTYHEMFVETIANQRGMDRAAVAAVADGREFIGRQAKKVGLVDKIGTFETALDTAAKEGRKRMKNGQAVKENHPEVYQEIFDIGAKSVDIDKAKTEATNTATAAERERVLKILGAGAEPEAALKAIEEGLSFEAAHVAFFQAEQAKRKEQAATLAETLPPPAPPAGKESKKAEGSGFMVEVEKIQAEKKCSRTEALKIAAAKFPDLQAAWLEEKNS